MSQLLIDWIDKHGHVVHLLGSGLGGDADLPAPPADDEPGVPVFELSNVVASMVGVGESIRLFGDQLREAYPCVRLPYGRIWGEYVNPLYCGPDGPVRIGLNIATDVPPADCVPSRHFEREGNTCTTAGVYMLARSFSEPLRIGDMQMLTDTEGAPVWADYFVSGADRISERAYTDAFCLMADGLHTVCFAASLMNARNIVQQVGRPYRAPRKRDKKPLPQREMRVLRLDGRYVERESKKGDGSATPKRLHRYRGHWKEYGFNGHGLLFGKYQCRVWVPDGQRGAADLGVVDKRYEVIPWPKVGASSDAA